jgi:hypothetical protein
VEKQLAVNYKVCKACGEEKDFSCFTKDSQRKLGLSLYCRHCQSKKRDKVYSATYYQKNKDVYRERLQGWQRNNRDKTRAYCRDYYDKNKNSEVLRAINKRQARCGNKLSLTDLQEQQIKDFYWLAKDLTAVSGETYHVDHIVPLQGKNVCGLHVPWNLQVLPADINLSKGNRYANDA